MTRHAHRIATLVAIAALAAACGGPVQKEGGGAGRGGKTVGAFPTAALSKTARKAALQTAATGVMQTWAMAAMDPAMSPTDSTKIPHYYGPYPNWANSPFAMPDAQVTITGNGLGATAVATVGAGGAITAITVTNPGDGYTNAKVVITGSGTGATASPTIMKKGFVSGITVSSGGQGYTAPVVTLSGGSGGTGATAVAYGGVDQVTVTEPGSGYTFPTVDVDMPDGPDGVQAKAHATYDLATGAITGIVIDSPGSGYSTAPGFKIRNGTAFDPATPPTIEATATATLYVQSIDLVTFGAGYNSPPNVTITDLTGNGAVATATIDKGGVTAITVTKPGSGYIAAGGIRKFVDRLPGLGPAGANLLGQYIPVATPDLETYPVTSTSRGADYYEIAVVQYTEKMHTDLPPTTLRGYVQLVTAKVPPVIPGGYPLPGGKFGVDKPHYLGPAIVAQKDKPVRITFYNLLPTGAGGDLFLPVDSSMMGSGMGHMEDPFDLRPVLNGDVTDGVRNPMCTKYPKMGEHCFTDNRATLHLHGGNTPWISDGTPHQWITPAGETTQWHEGVSVRSVPDMVGASPSKPMNVPDCSDPADGCMTFFYTNQQSARLMFYHDHAWGITRLNVFAGEAAAYVITDETDQKLVNSGVVPGAADTIPLVIQDRTFVPQPAQLALQDPTWDASRWGGPGNFWYHHVYMPAQNPADPSGMSAFGRWMYGPWFWPPQTNAKFGPIANPYYKPGCSLDDPATWQYQTDPFCEPPYIPGTPNISAGMEQFNDTPIVNGTAYPTVTLQPKAYRLRILNAANDRFWNLQWYVADATGTEVALKAAEVEAAQTDPVVFPTPDTTLSPAGPSWIQIGTEGGFLPAPAVIPPQPTTWITDPTRFDVGNVDKHSLLLAPAERADVVVDFSQYAGKTLILYNDAPAAFPARVSSYDYYTGAPDLAPVGAPKILPGYGPNTRTIMQVKIGTGSAKAYNLAALQTAFKHKADGSGVFESGQHPIIVGQAAYNSAYGTGFAASGFCDSPGATIPCDGFARIQQQGGEVFTFDTLRGQKLSLPFQPKAIHDEMNSSTFDEYGRMQANLGIEAVPATPGLQNINLMPYTFPPTEILDVSKAPRADVKVTPIATTDDGTQIWKFTHNGVDTHPIHFHAFDVQLLNRVAWDNNMMAPDANELGWKDTVRISPLQDTIVALRPVVPTLPFDLPNSVRLLSPMMPAWNQVPPDPTMATTDQGVIASATVSDLLSLGIPPSNGAGEPIDVYNHYVNFGAEYVYHCHILSHEEMDMMRPVVLAYPPVAPSDLAFDTTTGTLTWTDSSLSETAFVVERSVDGGASWEVLVQLDQLFQNGNALLPPLPNTAGAQLTVTDPGWASGYQYRVAALNTVGDTWDYANPGTNEIVSGGFPTVTTRSVSDPLPVP